MVEFAHDYQCVGGDVWYPLLPLHIDSRGQVQPLHNTLPSHRLQYFVYSGILLSIYNQSIYQQSNLINFSEINEDNKSNIYIKTFILVCLVRINEQLVGTMRSKNSTRNFANGFFKRLPFYPSLPNQMPDWCSSSWLIILLKNICLFYLVK